MRLNLLVSYSRQYFGMIYLPGDDNYKGLSTQNYTHIFSHTSSVKLHYYSSSADIQTASYKMKIIAPLIMLLLIYWGTFVVTIKC